MYYVSKRMEVAGSHHLDLPYESKCSNLHGHNWIITVHCKSEKLTDYGMIVDFALVKKEIQSNHFLLYLNKIQVLHIIHFLCNTLSQYDIYL